MYTQTEINYYKYLFRNIFGEDSNNSKEFSIFVAGNPHPLRIKLEDYIQQKQQNINNLDMAVEFETIIMNYIDNIHE